VDTRYLESFLEVVERGSLAAAARHLQLTPAAIAQRIEALEREIGVALVARSGRVVRPTVAGGAVLEKARAFLHDLRDLKSIAVGQTVVGEFRLGAISTALTGYIPPMLSRFMTLYPDVGVFIEPGTSRELFDQVRDDRLDAALIIKPEFPLDKSLMFEPIAAEPYIVLCKPALAHRKAEDLLTREPFIRYDRAHWGGRLADSYLLRHKLKTNDRLELDSLEAIAVMVDRGLGVSLVPDWSEPWPAGLDLAKVRLQRGSPIRTIGLIWSKHSLRSATIKAFLDERS
jgi:DNA-binding transcriptional LysR family regulator